MGNIFFVKNVTAALVLVAFVAGCTQPDSKKEAEERARMEGKAQAQADFDYQLKQKDKVIEKTRMEARAAAEAELQTQLANQDLLIAKARAEAKAAAEEDLKTQLENQEQLIAKARVEGRAQAEEALNLENGNLEKKAKAMEADLTIRHKFYQAVAGTFEGTFKTEQGNFGFRITLVPNIAPYPVDRVRQLDEISADLNGLYFNAQVIQWNPANPLSSVGCRVENIRPDLSAGTISISSSSCANLYLLNITDLEHKEKDPDISRAIATQIRSGQVKVVKAIVGEVRPTTNSAIYKIFALRNQLAKKDLSR
ncbi:MAG: hypothetical protein AB7O96_18475 [Pseudobdellovibrionaceae bacterium]